MQIQQTFDDDTQPYRGPVSQQKKEISGGNKHRRGYRGINYTPSSQAPRKPSWCSDTSPVPKSYVVCGGSSQQRCLRPNKGWALKLEVTNRDNNEKEGTQEHPRPNDHFSSGGIDRRQLSVSKSRAGLNAEALNCQDVYQSMSPRHHRPFSFPSRQFAPPNDKNVPNLR